MNEIPWWKKVLTSGLFWTAFIAWANGLILWIWPGVPTNLLALTNVLIGAILAAIGIGNVSYKAYVARVQCLDKDR